MSLLLRGGGGKDARGGQTSRPAVPNNNLMGLKRRDPAPRFTPSGPSNHGMRQLSTDSNGGDSMQVMLQRKVVTPNPAQRQLVGQKQQGEQQHGVISMEEGKFNIGGFASSLLRHNLFLPYIELNHSLLNPKFYST